MNPEFKIKTIKTGSIAKVSISYIGGEHVIKGLDDCDDENVLQVFVRACKAYLDMRHGKMLRKDEDTVN